MITIFLDIDGVLNIMSPSYNTAMITPTGCTKWMEEHLIQRLHWLIEKTDADIVISSSWRLDMKDLQVQLEANGFKYWNKVVGETPYISGPRGQEIQMYLDEHPEIGDCFVVLEDEVADVCGEKCSIIHKLNVVEVDMKKGLTHDNVNLAKNILQAAEIRKELHE